MTQPLPDGQVDERHDTFVWGADDVEWEDE